MPVEQHSPKAAGWILLNFLDFPIQKLFLALHSDFLEKVNFGIFGRELEPSIISSSLSDWPRPGMLSRGQER